MYSIDSMYECMAEAVIKTVSAKKAERWAVCAAIWLGRQQIFNARDYWYAAAARMLVDLPAVDLASIEAQFSKTEDQLFAEPADWPELPASVVSLLASWTPAPAEEDLTTLRDQAVLKVDRAAEAYRMQFITPGFGQVMAYQQKLEEARAKLVNASVANDKVPHIIAEAEADGMTPTEKAQQIVDTWAGWQQISAGVEAKRMAAKKAIAAATTAEAITVAALVDWQAA